MNNDEHSSPREEEGPTIDVQAETVDQGQPRDEISQGTITTITNFVEEVPEPKQPMLWLSTKRQLEEFFRSPHNIESPIITGYRNTTIVSGLGDERRIRSITDLAHELVCLHGEEEIEITLEAIRDRALANPDLTLGLRDALFCMTGWQEYAREHMILVRGALFPGTLISVNGDNYVAHIRTKADYSPELSLRPLSSKSTGFVQIVQLRKAS